MFDITGLVTDRDEGVNAELVYSFEDPSSDLPFFIPDGSSLIIVNGDIDYETTREYRVSFPMEAYFME